MITANHGTRKRIEMSVFMRGTIPWLRNETMRAIVVQIQGAIDEPEAAAVIVAGINRILARENERDRTHGVEVVFVEEALGELLLEAIQRGVLREARGKRCGADSFGIVTTEGDLIVRRSRSRSPRNFLNPTVVNITEEAKDKQSA